MANLTMEVKVTELDIFKEVAKELVFLRFFYKQMCDYDDVASGGMKEAYCGELPEGY